MMAAPQYAAWLAGKARKSAPAALRDALTPGALDAWLACAGLQADQRGELALSARQAHRNANAQLARAVPSPSSTCS